jgi:hypothetical protein
LEQQVFLHFVLTRNSEQLVEKDKKGYYKIKLMAIPTQNSGKPIIPKYVRENGRI